MGGVLGGSVAQSNPPEIGVLDISLRDEKNSDPLFNSFPDTFKSVQWHSYEVQGLEQHQDVSIIASSSTTKFQIFRAWELSLVAIIGAVLYFTYLGIAALPVSVAIITGSIIVAYGIYKYKA